MDATNLNDGLWLVRVRVPGLQYFLEHHYGFFYILTNASMEETAFATTSEYKIIRCKAEKSKLDNWKVVIKPDKDMSCQDMDVFDGHLVLSILKEGIPLFCSIDMHMLIDQEKPMQVQDLQPWVFPMPSSLCNILSGSNLDFMSSIYRVVVSSPVMPDIVVDYDLRRRNFSILDQEEVLGSISASKGHSLSNKTSNKQHLCTRKDLQEWSDLIEEFSCERMDVVSHDGTRVPLTIVYSRQARMGNAPGILHGYGAYGEVLDKSFCSNNISLLSRGWIIAYADVRGGGGDPAWHKAGTGLCKLNSFYDFAACAKFLINEGYVHKNQLAAMGCSAGGLLVGTTINMFPDLFSAAILKVPFLDICNTLLDPSLPLTNLDYDEFGDPRLEKDFKTIHSYSPYDNIHANICYPSVMVTSSFHDSRVGVWEAAKWVARVRETTCHNCSRLVILKTNMSGGHFAEGGRYSQCEDAAYEYAFLMKTMGLLDEEKNYKVL
ncbi:hypothetical protein HPP92_014844 [Vanilla planifolia]|uniref:Prolyl endopeptidase n=1 Tax=Vanilla planifolia TaxID=51239 RepID=A0A835QVB3_VANPL|nr:hypothetical protein HPP92_014844 [Vanilla planifolia]